MKVLVACEESQATAKAFRKRGIEAYSCDIKPCSGGHPEYHIQGCALKEAYSGKYEMMIAHPPCTYLAVSGSPWLYNDDGSKNIDRWQKREEALQFVLQLMHAPIKRIAIENPLSVISSQIRKPDCIVHPYHFGDKAQKATCFWLKNLYALKPTNIVEKGEMKTWVNKAGVKKSSPRWFYDAWCIAKTDEERRTLRSKTFQGMANAIAKQWGDTMLQDKFEQLTLF